MAVRHLLSEKNFERGTAVCSVDGSVRIYKNGASWICAVKRAAVTDRWRDDHPGQRAASRATVSAHKLTEKNITTGTGVCPVCGPVDILPFGRGYACGNRARQLRHVQEEAPASRCWKCKSWESEDNTVVDEVCRRCADELVPGKTLAGWDVASHPDTVESRRLAAVYAELEEAGLEIGYPTDPYEVDDFDVVPGWKTIGPPLPA